MAILFFSRALFFCLLKTFYFKNYIGAQFLQWNQNSKFWVTWPRIAICFLQLNLNQSCLVTIPQTICSIACVFFCSRAKLYVPSTINIWKKCAHQSHLGKQEKGWFLAYCLYIKSNWSIKQYRNLGFNLNFPIT